MMSEDPEKFREAVRKSLTDRLKQLTGIQKKEHISLIMVMLFCLKLQGQEQIS